MTLVQINDKLIINLDAITYADGTEQNVEIHFTDGSTQKLDGDDVKRFTRHLRDHVIWEAPASPAASNGTWRDRPSLI